MIDLMTQQTPDPGRRDQTQLTALVERAAAGDRGSFGLLYDEVSPVVHGICRRVLRNEGIAAETTQEVMLELWTRSSSYDPARGTVYAWAAMIAHRRAVDGVRSESSRRVREHRTHHEFRDVDVPDAAGGSGGVDTDLLRREESDRVRHCLGELTDLENESLVAAYFGGRTYSEVASHLTAPLATVKSRISSALSRMRTCLEMS